MIGFILQTTIVFGILYLLPWYGNLVGEAKLAGASFVAAVVASAVISLLWDMLKAPSAIYHRQRGEIAQLAEHARLNQNARTIKTLGFAICQKGKAAYGSVTKDRDVAFAAWETEALDFLEANFDPTVVFNFRTGSRFDPSEANASLDLRFSEKLDRFCSTVSSFSSEAERAQSEWQPFQREVRYVER